MGEVHHLAFNEVEVTVDRWGVTYAGGALYTRSNAMADPRQRDRITTTESAFKKPEPETHDEVEQTHITSSKGEDIGQATSVHQVEGPPKDDVTIIEPEPPTDTVDTTVVDEMATALQDICVKCMQLPSSDALQDFLMHVNNAHRHVQVLKDALQATPQPQE